MKRITLFAISCAALIATGTIGFADEPDSTVAPGDSSSASSVTLTGSAVMPSYPAYSLEEAIHAYIEAFNSGNENTIRSFHTSYPSLATLDSTGLADAVWQTLRMYNLMGMLILEGEPAENDSTIAIRARSDKLRTWFFVGFDLDGGSPKRVIGQFIRPAPARKE